jgi:hypothetical protein
MQANLLTLTKLALGSDFSFPRFIRRLVLGLAAGLIATYTGFLATEISQSRDLVYSVGTPVGGDFVAFYTAAHEAAKGRASEAYDPKAFEARLREYAPAMQQYGLTWQYPPTFFLLISPLTSLSYPPGYVLWTGLTAAAFFYILFLAGFRWGYLLVILAAPTTFTAVLTGQTGFLSAALLIAATCFAGRHPIAAGLAAAALTTKPQLGLLLPFAYIAAGYWRAFTTAALGAIGLLVLSIAVFGFETWTAFFQGFFGAADNLTSGRFQFSRMLTPFAAARLAGVSPFTAILFHGAFALTAAAAVALIWRRLNDTRLRAAALCAGVLLASPYGGHYEMVVLALPAAVLAKNGLERGWLRYERILLVAIFFLPLLMLDLADRSGILVGFLIVVIVFLSVLRRIEHDHCNQASLFRCKHS